MSVVQTLEADAKKVWTFGVSHVVLIACLFVSLVGSVYLFDSRRADRADYAAQLAQQHEAQVVAANTTFQQQTQARIAELTATVAQLQAGQQVRVVQLATQQKTDATMAPTDLADRWEKLVPDSKVLPTPSGYMLDPSSGLKTVQSLEQVPILTANLADEVKIANSFQSEYKLEQAAHTSDNDTCKVQLATDATTLKAVKADARKSKWKWFIAGVVTGFIGRSAIK
jgi:hypothetical protein